MSVAIDIGIGESDRKAIADGLSAYLADSAALYLKTHGFHWNVVGPQFNSLHNMFETQYNELWLALDEVAERIRALGHKAPASFSAFAAMTKLPEEAGAPAAPEMLRQLVEGHETASRTARAVFPLASDANDQPTADLLTQRMQYHEKTAWMLRSMLE